MGVHSCLRTGDASLATPLGDALFQGALMPFNTPDRLFTAGGRFTFSSGLTNWIQFGQLTNGTLIGMPSGGKPDHFGEAKTFVLGRSGITVGYSTNFFPVVGEDSLDTFTPPVIVDDAVQPGDTVYVRSGTYAGGHFTTSGTPVIGILLATFTW